MVKLVLWGTLKQAAGGETEIELELEAKNVREVLDRLRESYPKLKAHLDRGVSVSIDGVIFRDAWLAPVKPESEVYILPRLAGGGVGRAAPHAEGWKSYFLHKSGHNLIALSKSVFRHNQSFIELRCVPSV